MEANKLPLYLRRSKLSLVYWVKLKGSAIKVLYDCWEYAQQRKYKGFGWMDQTPPWILPVPKVNVHIIEQKRVWAERNEDNIGYFVFND